MRYKDDIIILPLRSRSQVSRRYVPPPVTGVGSFRSYSRARGGRKFGSTVQPRKNRWVKPKAVRFFGRSRRSVTPRSSAMARSFALQKEAASLLLHPFKGAYKGLKYPDADSSASVPITVRHLYTLTPTDMSGGVTQTGSGVALRVLASGDYVKPSAYVTGAGHEDGTVQVNTWDTAERVPDWTSYDGQFSKYRVVNFGIRCYYIGNDETNAGKVTFQCHPYGAGSAPNTSATTATYSKTVAVKDLKGIIVEPRRMSIEAMHYEAVTPPGVGWINWDDAWEALTIFYENGNVAGQPLSIEMVWNFECLPGNGVISSGVASPALPNIPHILNQLSTLGATLDRVQAATSAAAQNNGPNLMSVVGGIAQATGVNLGGRYASERGLGDLSRPYYPPSKRSRQ